MQYMTHEDHGRMPVYTPTDVEVNQRNGWILEAETQPEKNERDGLAMLYEQKFGKYPHHRMKIDTIRQKLDE